MRGEEYVIQVDESLFGGHRKDNVRSLFFKDFLGLNSNLNKRNNYGDRVQGPWVFGFIDDKTRDVYM
ncbi:hypothetical protein A0H76_1197 [Hepatospora eriocheir]|uniref:ISXO2-like transposase domain-containing protein n=1 Tax=Hepatospora eriocheir TaxID=1081669 RepID=A0A1X0Q611_9MICR|nr:hypothetical protein A0H76_1197 [Hepatospora eriocheir]